MRLWHAFEAVVTILLVAMQRRFIVRRQDHPVVAERTREVPGQLRTTCSRLPYRAACEEIKLRKQVLKTNP